MTEEQREAKYAAYRKGMCTRCSTKPYSAGRTVCQTCYDATTVTFEPGADRDQYECRMPDCNNPTRPGMLRCYPCLQTLKTRPK